MLRVAARELPETLRIAHPGTTVAFAKRDAVAAGYEAAVRAAREHGFEATLRLAGGRAAIFHDGTMEIGHAVPDDEPRDGIHERFRLTAD
jgi:octanoyl-[GcvH]:protein N-octanoyltransferase